MEISGNVALVTGAGSGLGAATAVHLAKLGATVLAADQNPEAAQKTANECGGSAVCFDVADADQVVDALDALETAQIPRIVVNCAGIGLAARVLPRSGDLSLDVFEKTIRVNLLGTYHVLSAASRRMMDLAPLNDDQERGVIINTASVAYQDGQIGQSAYAASKGGIASLTLPVARELARAGIRVMAIAPGLFETAMTDGLPDDIRSDIISNIPFPKRLSYPAEFAALAQQIVENLSLNGEVIRLDGGLRLPPK